MACVDAPSLRASVGALTAPGFLHDPVASVRYTDLAHGTIFGGRLAEFAGRSVLLACGAQLISALALIELDGVARRIVILPPDVERKHVPAIAATAGIDAAVTDAAVTDAETDIGAMPDIATCVVVESRITPQPDVLPAVSTEWLMLTSGTTGVPKLVVHSLAGLTAAIRARSAADGAAVWATFYDIRRYGGLQMLLRALLGGASLVLSSASEPVAAHLARLKAHNISHLGGTPSHWRRALTSPAIHGIAPRYVRLSGEIADQAILDALRAAFPHAAIGHAYASTEAGVAFDVNDGRAGFPASYVGAVRDGVEMKVTDGTLRIRSPRMAVRYAGSDNALAGTDGFVDTGDIVELRGDRYYFAGRRGGIINIGGLKVHPEEVEAVINRHPSVRMSLVRRRQSPVTGSVVVADVVLKADARGGNGREIALKDDILKFCHAELPRHKVPAAISFVAALNVAATGKLARR
ncbi:MAG: acyl--CoA ligase [Hyphomicrobiales bacterium]|nr:acyl--CoA ligase [Hyphomicrobiales bacterium]